jgi:hypothetical protein
MSPGIRCRGAWGERLPVRGLVLAAGRRRPGERSWLEVSALGN